MREEIAFIIRTLKGMRDEADATARKIEGHYSNNRRLGNESADYAAGCARADAERAEKYIEQMQELAEFADCFGEEWQ